MQCRRFLVSGRVQGVFYRASTQQQARLLELTGYASNLTDGSVEVLACGPAESLDVLERWLWRGPPQAQVMTVSVEEVARPAAFTSFDTF